MKKIIITLFIVLGTAFVLFGQCTFDTLVNGGVNHQMAFSAGESYQGSCNFGCEPDKYHCWQMPSGVNAQINVCGNISPPFTEIAVVITSECRWVHFSRCQVIGDPIMAPFTMQAYTESDMQICAYWNSNETDSVGVFLKGYAIPAPVLSIIGDMDTCGTLTALQAPETWETEGVLTTITGVPVGNNPPAGIYLEVYPDEAGKKPRLVRVLR